MSEEKLEFLERSKEFWNPGKTQFWQDVGVDLVIDRREGYFLYDMDGRRLIDVHLNGGTYNFGHRHPELVEALNARSQHFDMGNHHFPRIGAHGAGRDPARAAPGDLQYAVYGAGRRRGGRHRHQDARATPRKRRKIVSIIKAYHGHTGLAVATGDDRFSKIFLSDQPRGRSSRCRSTISTPWRTRSKGNDVAARHHGDHPRDLRLPDAAGRLSQRVQEAVREAMTRSTSPTRCRPA